MQLVVYLPALNEAETIGAVIDAIPKTLAGITSIQTIVIDDGSTDKTAEIAAAHGAAIVRHSQNLGTGKTFVSGVSAGLRAGADIIVSMDADGQFRGEDISKLIAPIMNGKSDVVLCSRFGAANMIGTMRWPKRLGNEFLTWAISMFAGTRFTDVSCGFRAISREAALRVDIHSNYEYIHECPVGESRIMSSVIRYALRSAPVLLRAIRDHSPIKFFGTLSVLTAVLALVAGAYVSIHWLRTGQTAPYTSLITLSVGGLLLAFMLGVVALLADLIGFQLEELVYDSRRARADSLRNRDVE
jgi:glycosyltransferase involved in cell wall biosynthesis